MHVILQAQNGLLEFKIVQQQQNVQETFTLAKLVIKNLLVCWNWHDVQLFIVCVLVDGSIQGDIWCYTPKALRSKWLTLLQRNGARTAHLRSLVHSSLIFERDVLQIDDLLLHIRGSRSSRNSRSPDKQCNNRHKKQQFWLHAFLICFVCIFPLATTIYMSQQKNI